MKSLTPCLVVMLAGGMLMVGALLAGVAGAQLDSNQTSVVRQRTIVVKQGDPSIVFSARIAPPTRSDR